EGPVVDILARGDRLFVLAEVPDQGAVLHIYDRFGAYRGFRAAGRDARALTWVVDGPAVVGAEGIRLFDADLRNAGIDTHRRPDIIDAEFTRGIWFLLTPGGLIRHE